MQIRRLDSKRLLVPLAAFALFLGTRCLVSQETERRMQAKRNV